MSFESWRGTFGLIRPTYRPGSLEDLIRLLPEGISVIPLIQGITGGSVDEFRNALLTVEPKVQELAEIGVDMIMISGAPPFMVHGAAREAELLKEWEHTYGVPVITAGVTQINSMRAMNMNRILGATYSRPEINELATKYFTDAGFDVVGMEGIDVSFDRAQWLSPHEVYAHVKRAFLSHDGVDGIYMLGNGWRVLSIIEMLEQDLQVPVVQSTPALLWSIQRFFTVRQPTPGMGRLLRDLPKLK